MTTLHDTAAPGVLPHAAAPVSTRLYALDNLRAAMMWLGIVLHVGVIHMTGQRLLPWRDSQTTLAADVLVAFIHAFRMPVFFLLAGFFVAMLLEQRGPRALVRHRLRRLALPFAVFWPPVYVLCAVFALAFVHRMVRGTWGLDPTIMPRTPGVPEGPITLHLWFLWMLLWLSLLTPLAQWLLQRAAPAAGAALLHRWAGTLGRAPWGIALLAAALAAVGAQHGDGLVHPSESFLPHWTEWAHNGLFYAFGLALYIQRHDLLQHDMRRWRRYAVAGLLLFMASGAIFWHATGDSFTLPLAPRVAFAFAYNAAAWCLSFALIGLFAAHLRQPHPALSYLADSSYWVYLVHMPLTIGFGALMFGLPWPAGAKIVLNIAATTAVCLASYHLVVRFGALGQLLNGKRHTRAHCPQATVIH
ncbi:acyltransferase family protein [Paracidovorax sp. MALMAid1276]|uniref:acyltransferase family protein n=1 Tax=Paracidovorax sp. MALMAid1276 TaxID=3411631 RepID=UPI003B9CEF2A